MRHYILCKICGGTRLGQLSSESKVADAKVTIFSDELKKKLIVVGGDFIRGAREEEGK